MAGTVSAGGVCARREALAEAESVEIRSAGGPSFTARILRPKHLLATALKIGRLKDLARVEALLDQGVVDLGKLKDVLVRHELMPTWKVFLMKSGKVDVLE